MNGFDFDTSDFDSYRDMEREDEFRTAYDVNVQKAREETPVVDLYGPIVYPDRRGFPVARILIHWYDGDVTEEEYDSPTQAKMRWDSLKFLHDGGFTFHVQKLEFIKLKGAML